VNATTPSTESGPLHARFDGPIVMIGFGSIGKGTLPLIERHIAFDRAKFVVIAPDDSDRRLLDERQIIAR
jgi:homospermidine synthase